MVGRASILEMPDVVDADVPDNITYYPLIASTTLAAKTQTLEPGDMDLL